MPTQQTMAAIDVGTTKICTIVGEVAEEGEVQVMGVGIAQARGLRKGVVVDLEEATAAIKESVEGAERSSGYRIVSAFVGISGGHISSLNNRGSVVISRPDRLITQEDVTRVLEAAQTINLPSNRQILHIVPRAYLLDGQEGVRNPLRLHGFRLDVETHIVTGATTSIQNLTRCIQAAGVEVDDLVFQPLASAEAALTPEEREMGVILADIGGGTTDVAIYIDGAVWHTAVIPLGGYQLSNDIAIGLRTPYAVAEEIKTQLGYALVDAINPEEMVDINGFGADGTRRIARVQLCEILQGRSEEILSLIQMEVKRSGYTGLLPAGIVLTGGSANLAGLELLASRYLKAPARVAWPQGGTGLMDAINDPAYTTSLGLLLWGIKQGSLQPASRGHTAGVGGIFKRVAFWAKDLLPQ